jgi:hypothetical protein
MLPAEKLQLHSGEKLCTENGTCYRSVGDVTLQYLSLARTSLFLSTDYVRLCLLLQLTIGLQSKGSFVIFMKQLR